MTRQTLKESQHKYNRWRAAREGLAEKLSGEIDDIVLVQGRIEIGPALEAKIRDVFMSIDTDSSNDIDQVELVVAFKQMGIELTEAESKKMIEDVDLDHDGKLSESEFCDCVKDQLRLWKNDQESNAACVIS